jgi:hypothetical protein
MRRASQAAGSGDRTRTYCAGPKTEMNVEHAIPAFIMGAILDKVVGPNIVAVLRPAFAPRRSSDERDFHGRSSAVLIRLPIQGPLVRANLLRQPMIDGFHRTAPHHSTLPIGMWPHPIIMLPPTLDDDHARARTGFLFLTDD